MPFRRNGLPTLLNSSPLHPMFAHTNQFIWFQGKSCVSSTFCSRCWKTLKWRIACPGFLHQLGFSASPLRIKNTWRHSGASAKETEGPWPTKRCPVLWETTHAQEKSSKWEKNWPTSLAEPPWLRWGASRDWRTHHANRVVGLFSKWCLVHHIKRTKRGCNEAFEQPWCQVWLTPGHFF